jgi:CRP-like cAMP-binding protein
MNPLESTLSVVCRCAFLKELSPDECRVIVEAARPCHFQQGEFFFHQGEPATTFYILVRGQAKLTQINPEGHQVIVSYIGPGDGLGIIVALSGMDYPIAAEAVEACEALAWDKAVTRQLMRRYPQLAINGMELIAHHFMGLQERYHQLVTQRVEQRIARTILQLVRQFGKKVPEGVRIDIPLTRQDLAEMTGTNLYNVSRFLSKWEQGGIIKSSRKRVTLCKPHELVVIAEDLDPVIVDR